MKTTPRATRQSAKPPLKPPTRHAARQPPAKPRGAKGHFFTAPVSPPRGPASVSKAAQTQRARPADQTPSSEPPLDAVPRGTKVRSRRPTGAQELRATDAAGSPAQTGRGARGDSPDESPDNAPGESIHYPTAATRASGTSAHQPTRHRLSPGRRLHCTRQPAQAHRSRAQRWRRQGTRGIGRRAGRPHRRTAQDLQDSRGAIGGNRRRQDSRARRRTGCGRLEFAYKNPLTDAR